MFWFPSDCKRWEAKKLEQSILGAGVQLQQVALVVLSCKASWQCQASHFLGGSNANFFLLQFAMLCLAFFVTCTLLPPGDFDLEAYVRFFPGVAIFTTKRNFIHFLSNSTNRLIYTLAQRPVCEKDLFWRRKRVFVMQGTTAPDGPQCLQSGGWLMCWWEGVWWGDQITSWRANDTIICPRNNNCRSNNHKFI